MIKNNNIYRIIKYLKYYKIDLIIITLSICCISISLLGLGTVFRKLIDNEFKNNYLYNTNISILIVIILITIFSIGSFFRSYCINKVADKIIHQIKEEVYNNIMHFPYQSLEKLQIGEITSRLTIDIEILFNTIVNCLSFLIRNTLMSIGGIILMFQQSIKLTSIVIITTPLLLLPLIRIGKHLKKLTKNVLNLQANIISYVEESINNIIIIQSFNQELNQIANFNKKINYYLIQSNQRFKTRSIFFAITIAIVLFTITLVIWIGSIDIYYNNITSGKMISFIYYAIITSISTSGIFEVLSEIPSSIAASERIFTLIDNKKNNNQHYNNAINNNTNYTKYIEFNSVTFSYPTRSNINILNNLSFEINQNQFIGIVGKSGVGKSTIMQLLLKFYSPNQGTIKIAGQDINKINTHTIRQIIGYVPQESKIFSGTIRSNISFAKPNTSDIEILNIANIMGITEFIKNTSEGLDTEIGERGIRISGGQKQRIAISRALIYKPEILLLDEATNALDNESEKILLNQLKKIMKNKIILSISHRISNIECCDKILVLNNGHIQGYDSHINLLKNNQIYQTLYRENIIS